MFYLFIYTYFNPNILKLHSFPDFHVFICGKHSSWKKSPPSLLDLSSRDGGDFFPLEFLALVKFISKYESWKRHKLCVTQKYWIVTQNKINVRNMWTLSLAKMFMIRCAVILADVLSWIRVFINHCWGQTVKVKYAHNVDYEKLGMCNKLRPHDFRFVFQN